MSLPPLCHFPVPLHIRICFILSPKWQNSSLHHSWKFSLFGFVSFNFLNFGWMPLLCGSKWLNWAGPIRPRSKHKGTKVLLWTKNVVGTNGNKEMQLWTCKKVEKKDGLKRMIQEKTKRILFNSWIIISLDWSLILWSSHEREWSLHACECCLFWTPFRWAKFVGG